MSERWHYRDALRDIAKEANEGGVFYPGLCHDAAHRCAYVAQMAYAALDEFADDEAALRAALDDVMQRRGVEAQVGFYGALLDDLVNAVAVTFG